MCQTQTPYWQATQPQQQESKCDESRVLMTFKVDKWHSMTVHVAGSQAQSCGPPSCIVLRLSN